MHRNLKFAVSLFAWLVAYVVSVSSAADKPNVVLILIDDFGYECVGANGGTSYKTPRLDQLAASGTRFEHCYAQPLCTPTRVQLMTGIYNIRNYTDFGMMDPNATTFAHLFKQAGYATGIAGKWQLGRQRDLPGRFGFDEHCLWQLTRRPSRYKNPGLELNGKEVDYTGGEYGPDIVNDWAIEFIERNRAKPFLLYYPMMLTHDPFEPTPDSPDYANGTAERTQPKKGAKENRNFAYMVAYADKLIGRLVDRLEELKLRENTLIVIVGDNGNAAGIRSRMGKQIVDGGKGSLTLTGMHVPLIVNWPGKVVKGQVSQDLVDTTDFLPTICAAAGIDVPGKLEIDGQSFWPQLTGNKGKPRDYYYSWYAPRREFKGEFAANQRFKLYRRGRFFDLAADPKEQHPLAANTLEGEAAVAHKTLSAALEKYKNARPKHLAANVATVTGNKPESEE